MAGGSAPASEEAGGGAGGAQPTAAEMKVSPVTEVAHVAQDVEAPPKEKLEDEQGVQTEAMSAEPGAHGCAEASAARPARSSGRRALPPAARLAIACVCRAAPRVEFQAETTHE